MIGINGAKRLALGLAGGLVAAPAWALDPVAFSEALDRMPNDPPAGALEHGEPRLEGTDTIVLPDLTMVYPAESDIGPIPLGTARFEGVEELPNGGYRYREASGPPLERTSEIAPGVALEWSVDGWRITNGRLPPADELFEIAPNGALGGLYDRIEIGAVRIEAPGGVVVEGEPSVAEYDWDAEPKTYNAPPWNFTVDMTAVNVPDPALAAWLDETGYRRLAGSLAMNGSFDATAGDHALDYTVSIDGVGSLRQTYTIGGLTPDVVEGFSGLSANSGQANDEAAAAEADRAFVEAISPVRIGASLIEFTDDGLTDALLNLAETQSGVPRASLVGSVAGGVPIAVGALNAPSLVAPAFEAVRSFLDAPGSIRIAVDPNEPVEIGSVIEAAQGTAPVSWVDLLRPSVSANGAN